jgi:chromosome segregation ATPase
VNSCQQTDKFRKAKEKESSLRFDIEEKLNSAMNAKTSAEEKARRLEQSVEQLTAEIETTRKALVQEKMVNDSLKEEIVKINKLKDALEEDLKNALATGRADRNKK